MNAFVTETMHERITLPVKVSLSTTCAQTETGPLYRASRSAVQGIWEIFSPTRRTARLWHRIYRIYSSRLPKKRSAVSTRARSNLIVRPAETATGPALHRSLAPRRRSVHAEMPSRGGLPGEGQRARGVRNTFADLCGRFLKASCLRLQPLC